MSIHKDERQPGKWVVSLRERDWTGQVKQHKKRGFSTQREAKAYERERLSNVSDCNSLTLRGLYEIYIKDCEIRLKAATVVSIKQIFQHHILPAMGEKALDDITPLILRNWLLSLKEQGFTYSTINTQRCRLSAFFGYAVRYYGLRSNPLSVVTGVLQREKPSTRYTPLTNSSSLWRLARPSAPWHSRCCFIRDCAKVSFWGFSMGILKVISCTLAGRELRTAYRRQRRLRPSGMYQSRSRLWMRYWIERDERMGLPIGTLFFHSMSRRWITLRRERRQRRDWNV